MDLPGISKIVDFSPISPEHSLTYSNGKVVLLATAQITKDNIFTNGLYQNVLVLYDMFESLGYSSYLVVNEMKAQTADSDASILSRYKTILPETIIHRTMDIHVYIEIGMSLSADFRKFLKHCGAKIVKLYLGNVTNIDIECVHSTPGIYFPHHKIGEVDEIWTSPHYHNNLDYSCVINNVPFDKGQVVPYVWLPDFVTRLGTEHPHWTPPNKWQTTDIVIMEPNISFQKNCLYPLLLANEFAKKNPEWTGRVILMNTTRLKTNEHAMNAIISKLKLYTDGRIIMKERSDILTIMKDNPNALFICHQWNNDYNYMVLELMWCGFPVLHNSVNWNKFGYAWNVEKWNESIALLLNAMKNHTKYIDKYTAHIKMLAWRHSPWNETNRKEWARILG